VENNDILLAEGEETVTLTATLDSDSEIFTSFSTKIEKGVSVIESNIASVHIYPNPAAEYLMINTKGKGNIKLVSSHGQVVYTGRTSLGETRIDVDSFTPGIYFLRYISTNQIIDHKVMIYR